MQGNRSMKCLLTILAGVWLWMWAVQALPAMPQPGDNSPPAATAFSASFNANAATAAYLAKLSPQAKARSDAYFEGEYWLILWSCLWTVGIAWLLLGTQLSARMRDLAVKLTRYNWLQTAIYAIQYIVLITVFSFPWSLYTDFIREHQYKLSNLSFGQWLAEQLKELSVALILGTIGLVVLYAVIRKARRTWWLWGAVVTIGFTIAVSTVAPVYIAPLFNHYKPLPERPLKTQILSLARANGVSATNVYEFDASRQSKRISANVSGMFGTTRISLNDNLLHRGTPAEIKAVLGHEMGHYVLNHVYKGIVFFGDIIIIGFAFVRWSFDRVVRRWGRRWTIHGVADIAGLPLITALLTIFLFVMTPVTNTITRSMEAEADAFGLNAARRPDGFACAALQLSEYRKMHPGPLEEMIFYDHPSGWNRIHRAMVWKAEHTAEAEPRQTTADCRA